MGIELSDSAEALTASTFRLSRTGKVRLIQFTIVILLLSLWEIIVRQELVDSITLSSPIVISVTIVEMIIYGNILPDISRTLSEIFVAFLGGTTIGIPIGWVLSQKPTLKRILDPYLITYYALPIFVFYPVFITLLGLGKAPVIAVGFLMSIIAVIINTANGFDQIPEIYMEVGNSLNLPRWRMFVFIYFPAAVPYIFTGIKLGFIYALIGVIASEFILASSGLGFLVAYYYGTFETGKMYAVMMLIIVFALVINISLSRIERRLYHRRDGQ